MTDKSPIERAHHFLSAMEEDIEAVANTAKLIAAMATSTGMVDCAALSVFGTLLREHTDYLREAFNEAHSALGGCR